MAKLITESPPTLLALLCILGFIGVATSPFTMFKPPWTTALGIWSLPYLILHVLVLAAALVGLWKMKRWGLILYAISILESNLFLIATGYWSAFSLVIFAALFSIPLYYRRAMS